LRAALSHEDLEVVFRAERILISLGESLDGQAVRLQNRARAMPFDGRVLLVPAAAN
jgi:hypothetical protein